MQKENRTGLPEEADMEEEEEETGEEDSCQVLRH